MTASNTIHNHITSLRAKITLYSAKSNRAGVADEAKFTNLQYKNLHRVTKVLIYHVLIGSD